MAKDQPGSRRNTQPESGRRRQPGAPDPDSEDEKLDEALQESFPASDPPQPAQPGVTGWDADKVPGKAGGKR